MIVKIAGDKLPLNGVLATTVVPGNGSAAVATFNAPTPNSPLKQVVHVVQWSYSAAPSGGRLQIVDSVLGTLLDVDIIAGGPGGLSGYWAGGAGGTITVTLAAVAATQGKLNVQSSREA